MTPSLQLEAHSLSNSVLGWLDRHAPWLRRLRWSALVVVVLSMLTGAPDLNHFLHWHPAPGERALDWKIHHPLAPIPAVDFGEPVEVAHLLKRTYRVTLPIVAYCLGLDIRGTERYWPHFVRSPFLS